MKSKERLKRRIRRQKDLSQLPRSELLAMKQQLEGEVAGIKLQLDYASSRETDHDWHIRANHALRAKGVEIQIIQDELARRKLERRTPTLAAHFMDVARQRLAPEVFDKILNEARELKKADVAKTVEKGSLKK